MSEKKKALIEAICDEFWFDYPDQIREDETKDEAYERTINEYDFTSWCYCNWKWMSLKGFIELADSIGLLDDDNY